MKTILFRGILAIVAVLGIFRGLEAQVISSELVIGDTAQVHRVATKRGDVFIGRVTSIQNTEVHFLFNKTIDLTFQLSDLESISVVGAEEQQGPAGRKKPAVAYGSEEQVLSGHTRGLFFPTGFLLKKGQSEYRNLGLFYNNVDIGLTDHINIGVGGIPLVFTNFFQAKLRMGGSVSDFIHVSANAYGYAGLLIFEEATTAAAFAGSATFGNPNQYFTTGVGYGFGFGGSINEGVMIANLGGAYRFSDNWRVFAEGIIPIGDEPVFFFSVGANWLKKRNRIEFGMTALNVDFTVLALPFLGYGLLF